MNVQITVDCSITSQKFDFDYDNDNTLAHFMSDLQNLEPPMGFVPNSCDMQGIIIDGSGRHYSVSKDLTLLSLGVIDNSVIVVCGDLVICGPGSEPLSPPVPPIPNQFSYEPNGALMGLKNKRTRGKLTNKKTRKTIQLKQHVGLVRVDIDVLTGFDCIKLASLNGWNESMIVTSLEQRVDLLRGWLKKLQTSGSVRTKVPQKFQNKSVETPIGRLPYENFVLWCTATTTLPEAALHTLLNAESLAEQAPGDEIINLIGKQCTKANCRGTIRLWDYASTPPK